MISQFTHFIVIRIFSQAHFCEFIVSQCLGDYFKLSIFFLASFFASAK
jgi:hypothetical protein